MFSIHVFAGTIITIINYYNTVFFDLTITCKRELMPMCKHFHFNKET